MITGISAPANNGMRLSDLYTRISSEGSAIKGFAVLLAEPDPTPGDDVDVLLSGIGWVEVDEHAGEVRLYPKSAVSEPTPDQDLFCVQRLLEALPFDLTDVSDLRVVAELPLLRDGSGWIRKVLTDVRDTHIGRDTEELWLLVRAREDYPSGQLPA